MVLINGWYFDFKAMLAFRKGNSYDKRGLIAVGTPPSILKHHIYDTKPTYSNFFCEPEDNFNNSVDQAYHEFLLTESIEDMLFSETNNS